MSFTSDQPLVSIIIPCYNCERWVRKAVQSCLDQTYPNVEIVVVDDGSTDGSPEVFRQFLPTIKLLTSQNRGGNCARNSGFAASRGQYIQYLDADDYLEPDKIAKQVKCLEDTKADVVYGDWRYRRHLADNNFSYLDRVEISEDQPDILASLLSGRWWVFPGAVLYRRSVIDKVGGWDESFRAAQDRDFFTSVALSGAQIRYQAGCYSVYRKHGATTVSTSNLARWVDSHSACLRKSENELAATGRLSDAYRTALALGYFEIARGSIYTIDTQPSYAAYRRMLDGLVSKILELDPQFDAGSETCTFRILRRLISLRCATRLLRLRMIINGLKIKLKNTYLFGLLLRLRRTNIQWEGTDPYTTKQVRSV